MITNHKKTKVGLLCKKHFTVYDVINQKKMWSLPLVYKDNYSATFTPKDEVIISNKGKLCIDIRQSVSAPFIQQDDSFAITCHPNKKELLYPSSNNTFSRLSLNTHEHHRYPRLLTEYRSNKNYTVDSAFYSPYSPHIVLYTHEIKSHEQKIFVLDLTTRKSHMVQLCCTHQDTKYLDAKFLPNSPLIAILCSQMSINFWDFIQQKQTHSLLFTREESKGRTKRAGLELEFNEDATHYAVLARRHYFRDTTPDEIILQMERTKKTKACFAKLILTQYAHRNNNCPPPDIVYLLTYLLYELYGILS